MLWSRPTSSEALSGAKVVSPESAASTKRLICALGTRLSLNHPPATAGWYLFFADAIDSHNSPRPFLMMNGNAGAVVAEHCPQWQTIFEHQFRYRFEAIATEVLGNGLGIGWPITGCEPITNLEI